MIFYLLRLDKILPWGMVVYPKVSSSPPIRRAGKFQVSRPDWISGACLLIKKQVFDKVGLFDENYFMGIEDIDFCCRVRRAGYEIAYAPDIKILHYHQYTSKKLNKRLAIIKTENDSLKYFYKKFYPRAIFRRFIFNALTDCKKAIQSLKIMLVKQ